MHNGSALFTGDAGQGESNIRRWVLENDWLEAIIALPLNIFYNTGIATYIWVLANKKAQARRGKVQLIDASQWFQPLRRNLGKKNCELGAADIARILDLYLGQTQEAAQSKWFDTQDFGYWKVTIERPLRLKSQLSDERIESLRFATGEEALRAEIYATHGEALYTEFAKRKPAIEAWLKGEDENEDDDSDDSDSGDDNEAPAARKAVPVKRRKKLLDASTWQRDKALMEVAQRAQQALGRAVFDDHNAFCVGFDAVCKAQDARLSAPEKKAIYKALSWRDAAALPVIAKRSKLKTANASSPALMARIWKPWARIASWSSTNQTARCAIPSRCRCRNQAALMPFLPAKCCRTRRMPGSLRTRLRLATRFRLLAISTSPCRCGRWPKSVPISSRWSSRRKGCCIRLWGQKNNVWPLSGLQTN